MSGSDWGIIFKAGGLALIGTLSISLYVSTIPYSQSLQQEAANKAEIHRQNAEYVIKYVCSAPSADSGCVEQARTTQRESEREEYDLGAQRMSAWWAQVMGIAALIGMGLSALGVWLVWTTFRETKESNTISRDGIKSAEAAADRARLDMIDAERAFLSITSMRQAPCSNDYPKSVIVAIKVENTGRQNARDFEICCVARKDAVYPKLSERIVQINQIIPPNYNEWLREFRVGVRGDGPYYLIGFLSYRTAYGARFKHFFCWKAEGMPFAGEFGIEKSELTASECLRIPKGT